MLARKATTRAAGRSPEHGFSHIPYPHIRRVIGSVQRESQALSVMRPFQVRERARRYLWNGQAAPLAPTRRNIEDFQVRIAVHIRDQRHPRAIVTERKVLGIPGVIT